VANISPRDGSHIPGRRPRGKNGRTVLVEGQAP
jgi:hypothetical protein